MDWKLLLTTIVTIFLAELGDKTQFAAMAMSAQSASTAEVLIGVVVGLSLAGILGVVLGRVLNQFLSPDMLRYVSGVLFIAVGCWVLYKK